ncbi:hypothetical protein MMC25_001995 [Agyrium rufum]|nr:hypothetical protein [Agyrium rufum]
MRLPQASVVTAASLLFGLSHCLLAAQQQSPLGEEYPNLLDAKFDARVKEVMDHFHVVGASVAAIDPVGTHSKGYGYAVLPNTNATSQTVYATGSTTKSFTAAAMSMLIEETAKSKNPITWTTPISSLIRDDYVLMDDYATEHLTLEDSLSHRTGLPRHDYALISSSSPRDAVRRLRYLPFSAEIRTTFQYSNIGFVVIAHVIETLTGQWLGDFFRERIWEPLTMTSTYFSIPDAVKVNETSGHLARGYHYLKEVGVQVPEPYLDFPSFSGAGGILSTVDDYAKYIRAMIDRAGPISPAGHAALHMPRSIVNEGLPDTGPTTYSLGWDISTYHGATIIEHTGGLPGFASHMLYLPFRRWGFVLMANAGEPGNDALAVLMYHLLDELLSVPEYSQTDWIGVFDARQRDAEEELHAARSRLYPDAPSKGEDVMPPSLALEEYAGTYIHPAFDNVELEVIDLDDLRRGGGGAAGAGETGEGGGGGVVVGLNETEKILHATFGRFGRSDLAFMHVNGENFLLWVNARKGENGTLVTEAATKAEFLIGVDGRVEMAGIATEPAMGGEKMWFTKVA